MAYRYWKSGITKYYNLAVVGIEKDLKAYVKTNSIKSSKDSKLKEYIKTKYADIDKKILATIQQGIFTEPEVAV